MFNSKQILFFISSVSYGGTVTKTANYSPSLSVDGTADYGVSLTALNFVSGVDFPATDEISSVLISITFHKTDGSCSSPASGNAFHGEQLLE